MNILCEFVEDQLKETLEVIDAGPVWNKDPFLGIKRDVIVPTARLGPAKANYKEKEEGEDEEEDEAHVIG